MATRTLRGKRREVKKKKRTLYVARLISGQLPQRTVVNKPAQNSFEKIYNTRGNVHLNQASEKKKLSYISKRFTLTQTHVHSPSPPFQRREK